MQRNPEPDLAPILDRPGLDQDVMDPTRRRIQIQRKLPVVCITALHDPSIDANEALRITAPHDVSEGRLDTAEEPAALGVLWQNHLTAEPEITVRLAPDVVPPDGRPVRTIRRHHGRTLLRCGLAVDQRDLHTGRLEDLFGENRKELVELANGLHDSTS